MDVIYLFQDPAPAAPAPPAQPTTTQPQKGPDGGDAPQPSSSPGGGFQQFLIPLVLMFVVMYFLMLRPQRKQAKERETMLANLKKNDHIVTNAGIYGIVKQVRPEDKDLILTIDESKDVRIRVAKSAISGLVKASGAEGEAKAETQEKAKS